MRHANYRKGGSAGPVRLHAVPINEPEFEEKQIIRKDARYSYGDVVSMQRHKLSLRALTHLIKFRPLRSGQAEVTIEWFRVFRRRGKASGTLAEDTGKVHRVLDDQAHDGHGFEIMVIMIIKSSMGRRLVVQFSAYWTGLDPPWLLLAAAPGH